jgi:hypothetical protein
LALLIHDSLIVPRSGLEHVVGGFDGSFGYFAKTPVRVEVATAPDMARA